MFYQFRGLNLDPDNFKLKFGGTVVKAKLGSSGKEVLILIDYISPDCCKYFIHNGNKQSEYESITIINAFPKNVGYIFTKDQKEAPYYVVAGERQQRQGLCVDRLVRMKSSANNKLELFCYFDHSIYPTLKQAVLMFLGEPLYRDIALSPNFCINCKGDLFYRMIKIGKYKKNFVINDEELFELFNLEVKHG